MKKIELSNAAQEARTNYVRKLMEDDAEYNIDCDADDRTVIVGLFGVEYYDEHYPALLVADQVREYEERLAEAAALETE